MHNGKVNVKLLKGTAQKPQYFSTYSEGAFTVGVVVGEEV